MGGAEERGRGDEVHDMRVSGEELQDDYSVAIR